jgi:hypothetical protein
MNDPRQCGHPEANAWALGSNGLGNVEMLNFDGAVQSAVLGANVLAVRLFATARCHLKIAANPTASATTTDSAARDFILEQGTYLVFQFARGVDTTSLKIGAIKFAGGVAGILQIERFSKPS